MQELLSFNLIVNGELAVSRRINSDLVLNWTNYVFLLHKTFEMQLYPEIVLDIAKVGFHRLLKVGFHQGSFLRRDLRNGKSQ